MNPERSARIAVIVSLLVPIIACSRPSAKVQETASQATVQPFQRPLLEAISTPTVPTAPTTVRLLPPDIGREDLTPTP